MTDLERVRNAVRRVANYYGGNTGEAIKLVSEAFDMLDGILSEEIADIESSDTETPS